MILSLDPSLRAFGWSVIDSNKVVDCGCIITKPQTGLVSESDSSRVTSIVSKLIEIIDTYKVTNICSESPAGSKSSSAIKSLSLVKGSVLAIGICKNIPVQWITARNAKLKATGILNAEKQEVWSATSAKFPELNQLLIKSTKAYREAVSDSVSVYMASTHYKTNHEKN